MNAKTWEYIVGKGYHRGDTAKHHAKVARRGRQTDWEVWRKGRFGHITSVARGRTTSVRAAKLVAIAVMIALGVRS